jgi:uncharacterized coiled-coil protein SlyX
MPMHLLSGETDPTFELRDRVAQLEVQIEQQDSVITDLRAKLAAATVSTGPLRRELAPLKRAIDRVFGIMDAAGVVEESGSTPNPGKWELVKKRLTGKDVEVIDLLLVQGAMTVSNIANALRCSGEAARQRVDKLRGQGLLVKNGREVTLKP